MKTIDFKRLESSLDTLQKEFDREPFKYIVIHDFLRSEAAETIANEFPEISSDWVDARGLHTQNKWTNPIVSSGVAAEFIQEVNSVEFLNYLSKLTGISDLLEDPNLNGAGYHQTTNGGFLNVHVDFNRLDDDDNMDRRLNLLVYFNKEWSECNGGYLELWDMHKKKRIENICPSFNCCVIFETNEVSYHGHPVPVNVPPGNSRKSLSVYYYTKGRNDIPYVQSHNTLYVNTESAKGLMKIFANGVRHFIRKLSR